MRLRIAAGMLILLCGTAHSLTPVQRPLPPVNWEADADPRFDPPIEQVVLDASGYGERLSDETLRARWQSWGVEALEPLQQLLASPRWQPFSPAIIRMFYHCPDPNALPELRAKLMHQADRAVAEDFDGEQAREFRSHLAVATNANPLLAEELLDHPDSRIQYEAAMALTSRSPRIPDKVKPLLEALAASSSADDRRNAVNLLGRAPSKENDARARAIAATVSEELRAQTEAAQARMEPYRRADEPMRLVLDKEAGESS